MEGFEDHFEYIESPRMSKIMKFYYSTIRWDRKLETRAYFDAKYVSAPPRHAKTAWIAIWSKIFIFAENPVFQVFPLLVPYWSPIQSWTFPGAFGNTVFLFVNISIWWSLSNYRSWLPSCCPPALVKGGSVPQLLTPLPVDPVDPQDLLASGEN